MKRVKETLMLGLVAWLGSVVYGLLMVCAIIAMLLVLYEPRPFVGPPTPLACKPAISSLMHGAVGIACDIECRAVPLI